ncbi:acetyltransferase [Burkholderia sp. MSh2]|uniref:N-hydroxyarylamine O-acetyltransferase n=1 Tax=Burkholderia paludis TaxID=1506587 RepID=A0A6J5ESQ1_9BURK|nr:MULTISPECIES: arylamine N-acetyltransferase [Burkholderia]KEZ06244.1 acetyltransferase [Burkholderia sp. MSh2]CAB3768182.1 Arylamine N-acetyltransferase [Burkholderia paludis]VWC30344.1 N-hydroxyarylamine O-acetyltransferase [Burkholderia paludis]
MKAENFTLQQYFERIGFAPSSRADIATVAEMMRRQLFSVPFENLDVQDKKIVSLVPEDIVEKILQRNRGGYCYEVNGIFAMALQALGLTYQFVAARPMFYAVKRPRTHMAIVLTLNGESWLCDLGFGSYGIRAPLRLDAIDVEVRQDADTFMLSKISERDYLLKALVDGQWANQYAFDLSPQEWIDFAPANYMNSTHPDAIFVQKMLVILHNESGRKVLIGDTLKTVRNGQTEQRVISTEDRRSILSREFGLALASH